MTLRIKETESINDKQALLAHYQKYATNFSKRLAQLIIKCRVTAVELKEAGKLPANAIDFNKLSAEIGDRVTGAITEAKAGKFDHLEVDRPSKEPKQKESKTPKAPKAVKKESKTQPKAKKEPKAKNEPKALDSKVVELKPAAAALRIKK
jgi:hypothetical protein